MKTAKTTVTILSALASVVLLASCATKSTETQTSNNSSSDNQITMTYDQLRSRENTMSTPCTKNQLKLSFIHTGL